MAGSTDGACSYRYERKFKVPFHMQPNMAAILRNSRFGFREIYGARTVNNVYFDTPLFRFFHENVQGAPDRKKIRIRWYGDAYFAGNCQLEIKRKIGLVGIKDVVPLTLDANDIMQFDFFDRQPLPDTVRFELSGVRPTLFNRYRRRYFLSADERFRMTIDFELCYNHPSMLNQTGSRGNPDIMSVLELKYDRSADSDAAYVTADIPLSLSKKSKYVTGVCEVYDS
ncbi:MAG: polyphosphate polymerase domain-containing protein [Pseudodesulfovibrio sp.]|uniref:polyphosphate polymerase domain-containing protein n=1 Tax=Pseudodesulfovibrio sp. TaxID=2035812 RepID=UPI003D0DBB44